MKILGAVLGVLVILFLGYTTLFVEHAVAFARSNELVNSLTTIGVFGSAILMWSLWVADARGMLSISSVSRTGRRWIYLAATTFAIGIDLWTQVSVFDHILSTGLTLQRLLVSIFFVGVPLGTSILLIEPLFIRRKAA